MKLFVQLVPAALMLGTLSGAFGHGLIQDPPSRNWFCGATTKPDHVLNGVAQYPACGGAFAQDFSGGYSFMSVLTHAEGRAVVNPLPENVCGFNSETWQGRSTPWDAPIDWPTTVISGGVRTFTWNISWGSHFSDTKEFRYWITKPDFRFEVGKPLKWSDFEDAAFCTLPYDDSRPAANPDVTPDKARALFHTRCTVPQRQGRHVIYGEWGRNHFTYERFHGCVDVVFGSAPGFSLTVPNSTLSVTAGQTISTTVSISRAASFAGDVGFSITGLPAGVTATFSPAATSGGSAVLALSASSAAAVGTASLVITGASGSVLQSVPVTLDVRSGASFTISAPSSALSVSQGSGTSVDLSIIRNSGFSAPVTFGISQLPPGITASFSPASTTGPVTKLNLYASNAAPTGPVSLVVSASGGSQSHSLPLELLVSPSGGQTFSLSTPDASGISVEQGATRTVTIDITRISGFGAPVAFTASELPSGIAVAFAPVSSAGAATTMTVTASAAAITGASTVLVTGSGGGVTKTLVLPVTVRPGAVAAGATITPKVNVSHSWYHEMTVQMENRIPITGLSVTIRVQKTQGISYAGQYNTIGNSILQTVSEKDGLITYQYVLAPGQSLREGTHRIFAAQASGAGYPHATSGDTYEVKFTSGGSTLIQSGRF